MKHLILKELHLENFQKFQCETFTFSEGQNVIRGENRAGKTTIQSAMLWLLFGKDAYGQTDTGRGAFDIKRRVDGQTVAHTDVIVEGSFLLTEYGEASKTIRLRRVLHECWNKKHEYTGDETQCFVDDVPYKITEYQTFIASFLPEEEFRMISSVGHFLTLKTDFKRQYLTTMAGVQSIEDFVAGSGREEWKKFIADISGKSLEEALKQLEFERKKLKKEYETIDPKIQSLQKVKPESLNWEELEATLKARRVELTFADTALRDASQAAKMQQDEVAAIRRQASQLRSEFHSITQQIEDAKQKAINDARKKLREKDAELMDKKCMLEGLESKIRLTRITLQGSEETVKTLNERMKLFMDEYNREQASVYQPAEEGQILCPLLQNHVCQSPVLQAHFADNRAKAEADFNTHKAEQINAILDKGRKAKRQCEEAEQQLSATKQELQKLEADAESLRAVIAATPVYSDRPIDETTLAIPEKELLNQKRMDLNKQIAELEEQANKLQAEQPQQTDASLAERRNAINRDIESIIRQLAIRDQIDTIESEISQLSEHGKALAAQITDIENREATARDINREIMEDATGRVNQLFEITTWQLFELQKNGLYAEVCKPTIGGVCNSLNSEARINIGIDICNAISRFTGLSAPLFIDNAESVNQLLPTVGQSIEMYVAPAGTKLTINQ